MNDQRLWHPNPDSPAPDEAPAAQLAVIMKRGVFENAGVRLNADQQASMIALVAQAARISALDGKRADARGWFGCSSSLVVGLALPVGLVVHWQLSVLWVPLFLVAVCLGCLLWLAPGLAMGGGDARDPYATAVRYAAFFGSPGRLAVSAVYAVVVLSASLGATVYAFTSSFPDAWAGLALGVAAGPTWLASITVVVVLTNAAERAVPGLRHRPDPYAALLCGLLEALSRLRTPDSRPVLWGRSRDWPAGPIWPSARRRSIAAPLELAARTIEGEFVHAVRPSPSSAVAEAALADHAHRVAAWLRARQLEILTPSPVALANVELELARGFAGVCLGDWSAVQREPMPPSPRSRLRRALPRVLTAVGLVGAAAIAPEVFGGVMDASAVRTLQVALAVTAAGALITPQQAVTDAIANVQARLPKGL